QRAIFRIQPESWFKDVYQVDEVHFNDPNTINETLRNLGARQLLLLDVYQVDEVHFNDPNTINETLRNLGARQLLLLVGYFDLNNAKRAENTDSGSVLEPADFKGKSEFPFDTEMLYPIMGNLRVFKTDKELEVMRYSCKVIFISEFYIYSSSA
uniref:CHASE2 domain-containing protein n=1 Tax=Ascaris lumbricoides TaxID=6252 RepID=A0A0M3IWG0_ASCLU